MSKYTRWMTFLILCTATAGKAEIAVQDEPLVINSGEAEYNGKEISLTGNVVIQHSLGKIAAQHLTILPSEDKKMRFAFIKMDEDIRIDLQGGGQLNCQQAEIDYQHLKGVFQGNAQAPDVVYIEMGNSSDTPDQAVLMVKSEKLDAELQQQLNPVTSTTQTVIKQLQAIGNIRAYYNNNYLILADHAHYQRLPTEQDPLAQTLTLSTVNPKDCLCQITNKNGDLLQAERIQIKMPNRQLICFQPRGTLVFNQKEKPQQIEFAATTLTWDDPEQKLLLQGQIQMHQAGVGDLKANKEVTIQQHIVQGQKAIHSISSKEGAELSYIDPYQMTHHLINYGPLLINHEKMQVILHSPINEQGEIPVEKQIHFENLFCDAYANQMQIDYKEQEQMWTPVKIILQGQVKILNRFDGHIQETGSILHYVLADHIEYFPETQDLLLSSQEGKRVLFYDKVNNVQMSAASLKIKRDPQTHKESIQGIGDVRFTFIEHEFDQFKEHFRLEDKNPIKNKSN